MTSVSEEPYFKLKICFEFTNETNKIVLKW